MTNIQFIFNVIDKKSLALRLVTSLSKRKHSILIFCENSEFSANLSRDLWLNEISFTPNSEEIYSSFDRIFLTTHQADLMDYVLVNCSSKQIEGFSRYLKFYELVSSEEQDKNQARERYQFYRDCGFRIHATDESELVNL